MVSKCLKSANYKLIIGIILIVGLCFVGRFVLLIRPSSETFPLKPKWQTDLGFSTYERPIYQDGMVLFPTNGLLSSRWYGVKSTTGQTIWSQRIKRNTFLRCLTNKYLVISGTKSFAALIFMCVLGLA